MNFPWLDHDLWIFPGGGIEAGESARAAVVREIYEETGATDIRVVGEVWRREFFVEAVGMLMKQRYFLIETERFDAKATALLGDEADWLQEYRWWQVKDLADLEHRFEPENIACALGELIVHGLPTVPIDLA
jgi:8-oxo-dGTP pyrophosphatase MutT (NUDIX family)